MSFQVYTVPCPSDKLNKTKILSAALHDWPQPPAVKNGLHKSTFSGSCFMISYLLNPPQHMRFSPVGVFVGRTSCGGAFFVCIQRALIRLIFSLKRLLARTQGCLAGGARRRLMRAERWYPSDGCSLNGHFLSVPTIFSQSGCITPVSRSWII